MKKYDSYKDSGIEWIGEIPSHWEIKKLNWCFELIGSGTTPKADKLLYYLDGNTNWLLTGDLNDGEIFDTSKKITQKAIDDHSTLKVYPTESIVMAMYGATIGKLGVLKIETTVNQACCVLSKPLHLNYKFAFYILLSARTEIINMSYGGGQPNISQELIKSFRVQIPPIEEQTSIASLLDLKTTEIDEIIAAKKRLLELYEEEKTAIINQAVTKGLDPNAPMKDSGIEWLGEIPEHWEVKRLKYIAKINPTKNQSYKDYEDEVVFLPMEKVKENGSFEDDITKPVNELWNGYTYFEKGDILIAKITPCFENGKGTLLSNLKTNFGFGSTEFHVVRANLANSNYLFYVTRSHVFMSIGEAFMTGAAGQKRVPSDFISEFVLALPSKSEQQSIVHHIESECSKIDFKKARTEELIELLTEYRAALISEAVTGKIKVTED